MDKQKLQEVFSDKAYVESIAKMSAEDAAKSLCEKGVEVTADDLMKVHDFIVAHKEEIQNGELSEEALTEVPGGSMKDVFTAVTAVGVAAIEVMGFATHSVWSSLWSW